MQPRRIGLIVFDDVMAMDVAGPLDVFHSANPCDQDGRILYEVLLVAAEPGPIRSESGILFQPHCTLDEAPAFDTLIVPGGRSLRVAPPQAVINFIQHRAASTPRVVSVCTGLYALAAAGLMDGRSATTHWRYAEDFRRRFPLVRLQPEAIFIRDGKFQTSAGVTAGIDLAMAMIEADHGPSLALEVARELVVFVKRPGGQTQYSQQLQTQMRSGDRFADLVAWLPGHLSQDLSVEAMSRRVNLSPRHFSRRFTEQFAVSPGDHVTKLRLEMAVRLLEATGQRVDVIAAAVGFAGPDVFRRSFIRAYGMSPSAYRAQGSREAAATVAEQTARC